MSFALTVTVCFLTGILSHQILFYYLYTVWLSASPLQMISFYFDQKSEINFLKKKFKETYKENYKQKTKTKWPLICIGILNFFLFPIVNILECSPFLMMFTLLLLDQLGIAHTTALIPLISGILIHVMQNVSPRLQQHLDSHKTEQELNSPEWYKRITTVDFTQPATHELKTINRFALNFAFKYNSECSEKNMIPVPKTEYSEKNMIPVLRTCSIHSKSYQLPSSQNLRKVIILKIISDLDT